MSTSFLRGLSPSGDIIPLRLTADGGLPIDLNAETVTLDGGDASAAKQDEQTVLITAIRDSILVGLKAQALINYFAEFTIPLGASASAVGEARNCAGYAQARALAQADQTGMLYIEQSLDGVLWIPTISQGIGNASLNLVSVLNAPLCLPFYRVRFTNSSTAQTVFRVYSSMLGLT